MLTAVLSGFAMSLAAPWVHRIGRGASGWLIALLPLSLTLYFARFLDAVATGKVLTVSYPWVPSLGISLSFYIDGLSLLFALLISGVGVLVVIYAGSYLAGHHQLGRFYAAILAFMASMLGLVLADNVMTLFIFWELTSVSSYLLIGFDHEREAARAAALQALLVTGAGGLALLAGLLLLGAVGGSLELSALLQQGETVRSHALYLPILFLILAGAFTKSAQVPFHFWLPGAMEAPTPVSAYLHSATMVKAGVYLLARLSPVLGGTAQWYYTVTTVGAATMLVGATLALLRTDLKRILAYSTVSALGTLVLLLGLNTELSVKAAVVFLLVHSLYKGALFLTAGAVDHETGTRDVARLGGLRQVMPITAVAAALAALSMAGLPPLLGFIGKELLYEAKLHAPHATLLITSVGVLTNIAFVAIAATVGLRPFIGPRLPTPKNPHEAPLPLWFGPVVLVGLSLLIGVLPDLLATPLVAPAVAAVRAEPITMTLALWHGLNPILALSVVTVVGGAGVYWGRDRVSQTAARLDFAARWGPEQWYRRALNALNIVARVQTQALQSGYLRVYVVISITVVIVLMGGALISQGGLKWVRGWPEGRFYEWVLAGIILAAAVAAIRASSLLAAVAALGGVGYGVALIYILFGAPDLAMTQVAVETLTVVLFVLVLYQELPQFARLTSVAIRLRDGLLALGVGGLMTTLVLAMRIEPVQSHLTTYFAENSLLHAKGRNVVNVILVDFRALDTLGEITVLAVAAIGVYTLLKLRLDKG